MSEPRQGRRAKGREGIARFGAKGRGRAAVAELDDAASVMAMTVGIACVTSVGRARDGGDAGTVRPSTRSELRIVALEVDDVVARIVDGRVRRAIDESDRACR